MSGAGPHTEDQDMMRAFPTPTRPAGTPVTQGGPTTAELNEAYRARDLAEDELRGRSLRMDLTMSLLGTRHRIEPVDIPALVDKLAAFIEDGHTGEPERILAFDAVVADRNRIGAWLYRWARREREEADNPDRRVIAILEEAAKKVANGEASA